MIRCLTLSNICEDETFEGSIEPLEDEWDEWDEDSLNEWIREDH